MQLLSAGHALVLVSVYQGYQTTHGVCEVNLCHSLFATFLPIGLVTCAHTAEMASGIKLVRPFGVDACEGIASSDMHVRRF